MRNASFLFMAAISAFFAVHPKAEAQPAPVTGQVFSCPFCDLSKAQFGQKDLTNANLQGAILAGADLRGADLRGAILDRADLTDADLRGAKLGPSAKGRASLSAAKLTNARLGGASLDQTDVTFIEKAVLDATGADFSRALIVRPQTATDQAPVSCGNANLSGLANRIYVAPGGADSDSCGSSPERTSACATMDKGISRCSGQKPCGVLVMYGQYTLSATVALTGGINVYGGCLAGQSMGAPIQSLLYAPANGVPAISADGIDTTDTILQGFRLYGSKAADRSGAASVTLEVGKSPRLTIMDSSILAGAGGSGRPGGDGSLGANGASASGFNGGSVPACPGSAGGAGAEAWNAHFEGDVWKGWTCVPSFCTNQCDGYPAAAGAAGGKRGKPYKESCLVFKRGETGKTGDTGVRGTCGPPGQAFGSTIGSFSGHTWKGTPGGSGTQGGYGGGGGGGGSGGYTCVSCISADAGNGNRGGGGGAGACGGGPGGGGEQGGAALAAVVFGGTLTLSNSKVIGGRSGAGGGGGSGNWGGQGGEKARGADGLTNETAGLGGNGGGGGDGGGGGGGAGGNAGPAIGVALVGGATIADGTSVYNTGASEDPGVGGENKCADGSGAAAKGTKGATIDKQTYN
jgi:hypothetical protein